MSSGGIVILPAAVVVAAGAVVVLTAAAAAVLVVRAANAAAEGAVRAIGDAGQKLEDQAAAQDAAAIDAVRWQAVASQVVELNARIRMMTERARRAGVTVVLPAPLRLSGSAMPDAAAWAEQAEVLLRHAQKEMYAAVGKAELSALASGLPPSVGARSGTAEALARYQETLRERLSQKPRPHVVVAAAVDVQAVLRDLDPDANEREHQEVLRAAAFVERDDPREAETFLVQLRSKVEAANATIARRRLAAQLLEALEEPVVARVEPPAPLAGTAGKLREVVAGDADLTPELRSTALEAVAWAEEVAHREFLYDVVRGCLTEQGYTVDGELDERSGDLRVTHADWRGEHSADVWVDHEGVIQGRVRREDGMEGDQAALTDRERCDDFNDTLEDVGSQIGAEVHVDRGHVPQRRRPADAARTRTTTTTSPLYRERKHGGQ